MAVLVSFSCVVAQKRRHADGNAGAEQLSDSPESGTPSGTPTAARKVRRTESTARPDSHALESNAVHGKDSVSPTTSVGMLTDAEESALQRLTRNAEAAVAARGTAPATTSTQLSAFTTSALQAMSAAHASTATAAANGTTDPDTS
eukprot:m.784377 g.784377  ORF g.784377 m.784377 type:complete len:146 (+) comp23298_c3_seq5:1619-2056(+)